MKKQFLIALLAGSILVLGLQFLKRPDNSASQATEARVVPAPSTAPAPSPETPPVSVVSEGKITETAFAVPVLNRESEAESASAAFRSLQQAYIQAGGQESLQSARLIEDYLGQHPNSLFLVSLLQEKGDIEWRHGTFLAALKSYEDAWKQGAKAQTPNEKRLAEAALAKLLSLYSRLGRKEELASLITSAEALPLGGTALEALRRGKETAWFLEHKAEQNVFCGFTAANEVCVPAGKRPIFPDVHDEAETKTFIKDGLSLFELRAHSHEAEGDLEIFKRVDAAAPIPVPSVIHWNFGHYSAVTERAGDLYRVVDTHLRFDSWVSADTLREGTSGYVLAAASAASLPAGHVSVSEEEAKTVHGRHCIHGRDNSTDRSTNRNCGGSLPMATYEFRLVNPGLEISDTPISYEPPYGPGVAVRVEFDQRSTAIPDLATHANFGPRWTYNLLSYADLKGTGTPSTSVHLVTGDGNYIIYSYQSSTKTYRSSKVEHPRLTYLDAAAGGPAYRLEFSDGGECRYAKPNLATPTRYYLTTQKDPQGNALTLGYDASLRLSTLTDAAGYVTNFSYTPAGDDGVQSDTTKVRAITDPFGRTASFRYTATGQLRRITDPAGVVSEFQYAATGDFVEKLTTPYGATSFVWGDLPGINNEPGRFIEATDANGDKERVESNDYSDYPADGVDPYPAPESVDVNGVAKTFLPKNDNLFYRNTFHWDKLQMKAFPRNYAKATIYNWKADNDTITDVLGSLKTPLEGRVWFNYPGQTSADGLGTSAQPAKSVRAVENHVGTPVWIMEQNEYDSTWGKPSKTIDPNGRETVFEYNNDSTVPGAVKGQDLTAIKIKRGAAYETIARYTDFVGHQPQTAIDAAGQTSRMQYNAVGQVTSVTNAKSEVTTYAYYSADITGKKRKGRLSAIDGPLAGTADTTTFDYDSAGNLASVTAPDGHTLAFLHDSLNRLTRTTFPDATYTETTYQALTPSSHRDRLGRMTSVVYNNLMQLESVTDPAGRVTKYTWCRCGDMRQLIDAMGRTTTWRHDENGRISAKIYPDGSTITYGYEPFAGRLRSVTDEKGQVKYHSYFIDGSLASIDYRSETNETPGVSYTYDADDGRLTSMKDGIGTTTYAYHPVTGTASPGAGQLASVDGPWNNDTIAYQYDELGRMRTRTINGVGETVTFDAGGRLTTAANALGTFTYAYDGVTSRLQTITHSGGLKTRFTYHPALKDFQLQRIENLKSDGVSPISVFNYTYDAAHRIQTWTQQEDASAATAKTWTFGHDNADQLTSLVITQGASTLSTYGWTYDPAGNRLTETLNGSTANFAYNALNELNLSSTNLAAATYEWDAEDRLIAVNKGTQRSEFVYDGESRRAKTIEKTNGAVTSAVTHLWDDLDITERRSADGSTVQQRYLSEGFVGLAGGPTGNFFYAHDHLGSIRELVNSSGAVQERIGYDAWGKPTFSNATPLSTFAFTGHVWHPPSGLVQAPYRSYAPGLGRWINRDPLGEVDGPNVFAYAHNQPHQLTDPTGEFVPLFVGFRIFMAALSVYDTYKTFTNPCATMADKALTLASFGRPNFNGVGKWVRKLLGRGKAPPRVLLDSNVTTGLKSDPTLGGRIHPGEVPIKSYVTIPEMKNAVTHGNLRGVPGTAYDLPTLLTKPSLNTRINIRGMLPDRPGRFGDGIIGGQAIENNLPLITNDKALQRAIETLGGATR